MREFLPALPWAKETNGYFAVLKIVLFIFKLSS